MARHCHEGLTKRIKNAKNENKILLEKTSGKIRVARNSHHKCLLHKSKRANKAGAKPQYLNDNMMGQAKILAPYGLK